MAKVKVYIDDQLVLDDIASDMLAMTGWSDTDETTYCDISTPDFKKVDLRLDSDTYIAYFGDELVTLAISDHRNVTIAMNTKEFKMYEIPKFEGTQEYDYLIKKFYLSSRLTEYKNDLINLLITRYDNDWIYLRWEYYENSKFEAYISVDL